MERLLAAMGGPAKARRVPDEELNDIMGKPSLSQVGRTGAVRAETDPTLILNAFTWDSPEERAEAKKRFPHLRGHMLLGDGAWGFRDAAWYRDMWDGVCQSAMEIHAAWGCLHSCAYCHVGNFIVLMLNLEELAERLEGEMPQWPQKLYKFDNQTDTLPFEPEYGASKVMVDLFSRQEDRYLLLYTKSDNVDHLLDLDHRGKTLISWSISTDAVSRQFETGTPLTHQRIEAAKRCQDAGYRVRFRISPIIPILGWREEYDRALDHLFSTLKPDLLTLDVLGWMTASDLEKAMGTDWMDEEAKAAIYRGPVRSPYNPQGKQLFLPEYREKIYRFMVAAIRNRSPETPLSICMETPDMWEALGDLIDGTPQDYPCCCGPNSVPGPGR